MGAVFEKEFRQYASSMMGAIFLAAFFALTGYYFVIGNLYSQNGDISTLFTSVLMMSMFLCPALTMRLLAEEKKMGTDQMLFTAPVSLFDVVLGKFLACWCFFLCASLVIVLDIAILAAYGCFQPLVAIGNLVGLWLSGAAFLAIGMFLSSLTENQLVAAILTYSILLGLWLLDFLQSYLSNPILLGSVRYLSYRQHYAELSSGIFSLSTFVYCVGVCLLFLALTVLRLKREH
ncbi:ABC transporter permease [Oscillospiraceae bacterium LTW-04]|nr:ABC transporter permease subunit [Oscillospiraceae bacterium MB24-C1]